MGIPSTPKLTAGLSALFVSFYLTGKWNLVDCGTGILALFASKLLKEKLFIDDPVDAIPVHLVGGSWGVLCVGLFPREGVDSVFFTGNFLQLGYQIAGLLALVAWTGGSCAVEDLEQQAHSGSPVATPTGNSAEFKRGGSADFAPHRMVSPKGPALAKQGTSQAKVRNKRSISWVDQGELRNAQAILSSSESADVLQKGEDDPVVGSAPEGQPCAAAEEVSVSEGKDEWAVPEDEDFCLPGPGRVAVTGEGMHED
uniref:Ammonium transporter AmtB-like domain-containing protein n=1 Tax=Chromera velia CCMP2878 TaxID=1169474 RepID=A0A0G4GS74_9ALVE|eukprot:Cvel_23158.t1-p1 / transcript=Cvel_23158.t1 / gene=Cvel_23158 / organism=Chromera_velia_CCMP2878 / gene_product=Ammonium transporter 2, putative / transcript_product=Ammonium transporter 2, putative / location=Cvel_scaffold2356:555-6269(+) / protein_length=254 / sequence_SO=supercontig / SO=protein_coding / is_pseudo=false